MPKELVHRILLGCPLRIEFSKLMLLSSGPTVSSGLSSERIIFEIIAAIL